MPNLIYLEHYCYDDYKHWEGSWELIDGQPYAMTPSPNIKHQRLAYQIARILGNQIANCNDCEVLGEVDYKISNDTVLKPDVVVTCGETHEAYLTKAPEIIFEIISPSTAKKDETYKFSIYEAEKLNYYVLVYPSDLRAKIYKLKNGKFDKEGDYSLESYDFENTRCKLKLNFAEVFKRYL